MNIKNRTRQLVTFLLIISLLISQFPLQAMSIEETAKETQVCDKLYIATNANKELSMEYESFLSGATVAASRILAWIQNEKYYLLLPSYTQRNRISLSFSSDANSLCKWDGTSVQTGSVVDGTEGEHILNIGEESYVIVIKKSQTIGAMFLTTDEPLAYIHANKQNKTTGAMTLLSADGTINYDGGLTQIKERGNSTFYASKKPYQIKLEHKSSLLGMGEAWTWLLLANAYDESGIRNKMIYDLANAVGLAFTTKGTWVDLYINGEYRGNYLLSEKVEIAKDRININDLEKETEKCNSQTDLNTLSRFGNVAAQPGETKGVNVPNDPDDISGGYLLEVEASNQYDEEISGFVTTRRKPVVIKSPECASKNQAEYIFNSFQQFEDAICTKDGIHPKTQKSYAEYFDMDSFIKRYIIDEITRNVDAGITSSFYYKPSGEEPVFSGPCWDFDTSLGRAWGDYASAEGLGYRTFAEDDTANWYVELDKFVEYRNRIRQIYNELFRPALELLQEEWIPSYKTTLQESLAMNEIRWPGDEESIGYQADQERVETFLRKRIHWLNGTWTEEFEATPSMKPSVKPTKTPEPIPSATPTVLPSNEPVISAKPSLQPSESVVVTPTKEPAVSTAPTAYLSATPVPDVSISLSSENILLYETGKTTARLQVKTSGTVQNLSFTSSKSSVAKVDGGGKITAGKPGTAIIIVSAGDIKKSPVR